MATVVAHTKGTHAHACRCSQEAFDARVRQARRALIDARSAVEDFTVDAGLRVRKHPLSAIAVAGGIGLLVGTVFGFAWSRLNQTNA